MPGFYEKSQWLAKPPLSLGRLDPSKSKNTIGRWLLNDGGGVSAQNIASGDDLVITNAAWSDDGVVMDGSSSVLKLPYSPEMDLSTEFTIGVKFNWTGSSTEATFEHIVGRRSASTYLWQIRILEGSGNAISFLPSTGGSISGSVIQKNVDYWLIATYKTGAVRLYLNGSLDFVGFFRTINTGTLPISFGRRDDVEHQFGGIFKDAFYLKNALTAKDVQNHYLHEYDALTPRKTYVPLDAAVPTGFKPYWAVRRSQIIGSGLR